MSGTSSDRAGSQSPRDHSDAGSGRPQQEEKLERSITGKLLFFYVLGDVLGSGIYALIGVIALEVGGAFWMAFVVGVTVAMLTGFAYAELITKYPQAAGAALYVHKAFGNRILTFIVTFCMLAASIAAAGALALVFGGPYFRTPAHPADRRRRPRFRRGESQSAVRVQRGQHSVGDPGRRCHRVLRMTGFENAANVAGETQNPSKVFPRALLGGMALAGLMYLLVAFIASMVAPLDDLAGSTSGLLVVVKAGPIAVPAMVFSAIALVAVTNTTLVALVAQIDSRGAVAGPDP